MAEAELPHRNIMTEAGSAPKVKIMPQEDTGTIPISKPILLRVQHLTGVTLTQIQGAARVLQVFLHLHAVHLGTEA